MKITSINNNFNSKKASNRQVLLKTNPYEAISKINCNVGLLAYKPIFNVNNIAFKRQASSNDFKKWLSENNINNSEDLFSLVENTIKKENYLGSGTEQTAYSIENSDDYILKCPKTGFTKGSYKPVKGEFETINLGQTIAIIGNAKICKKQKGIVSSIPYAERINGKTNCQAIYLNHLLRAKNMPQKAYDDLALIFEKLNDKEKFFDYYNPNNILLDTECETFNIVDDLKDATSEEEINTFMSIINPLIDIRYMPNAKNKEGIIPIWQEIITKSFIASRKAGLPAPNRDLSSMDEMFKLAEINPMSIRNAKFNAS